MKIAAEIPHYEAEISLVEHNGRKAVKKRYRAEVPCVAWLNTVLAKFYPGIEVMPVAAHEFAVLELMSNRGISPAGLELGADYIIMEYGGTPLRKCRKKLPAELYRRETEAILKSWGKEDFRHNDIGPDNVLWDGEKIQIIDYTLAEYGKVRFLKDLPNPDWARPGKDGELPHYLEDAWQKRFARENLRLKLAFYRAKLRKMLTGGCH